MDNVNPKTETKAEEICIYSLINKYELSLPKYCNSEGVTFPLTNIRAIVLHQDPVVKRDIVEDLIPRLLKTNQNPYHFIIDSDGKIFQLNNINVALRHIRSKKYSRKANDYFGDTLCPLFEDTVSSPHNEASPDNCTISIMLPSLDENGTLGIQAANSLKQLCAYILNKYARALQAPSNILCAYQISESLISPVCFKNTKDNPDNEKNFELFKYDIEKKRSKWYINYGGTKRGYCSEIIYDMTDKKEEE